MKPVSRSRYILLLFGALLVGPWSNGVVGQATYPTRPIHFVIPWPPGGASDIIGRRVAEKMGATLGVPMVVENRGGASGAIGAMSVVKAPPDGYTVLFTGDQVVATGGMKDAPYNGAKDLLPVALVSTTPMAIVSGPALPVKTLQELIAVLKAHPGKYSYASSGDGSVTNLGGEMFKRAANVDMVHVPYRGGGPAMVDLIGGHVPIFVGTVSTAREFVDSGKVTLLATLSDTRLAGTSNVPTASESGLPSLAVYSFTGVFVPVGTPQAIIQTLNQSVVQALKADDLVAQLQKLGVDVASNTSPEFAASTVRAAYLDYEKAFGTPVSKAQR